MKYIAPRSMTVVSTSGRSAEFEKGVPLYCPPQMHADLIAVGVVPAEEIIESDGDGAPKEPTLPDEREAAIFSAFEKIVLRAKRGDFSGTGAPHNAVLAKELGWSGIDAKERDAAWQKFQLAKAV